MINKKIFESILNGRALLITGSGVNAGIKNSYEEDFPQGKKLSRKIYKECGIDNPEDEYDLQDASQTYLEKRTDTDLIILLRKTLTVGKLNETVKVLYSKPWIRCYTTNYDDVPLLASKGKPAWTPVTIDFSTKKYLNKENVCVYINGYIGSLNEETLNTQFKLTSKSYLSEENLLNSQWGMVLKNDLELAETVIIVGLSLEYDLDLKRIISSKNIEKKTFFIEQKGISTDKKRKLGRLGNVLDVGVEDFCEKFTEFEQKEYVAKEKKEQLLCFKKNLGNTFQNKARASEVYNFLMFGECKNNLFQKENGKYINIIYRNKTREIMQAILQNVKVIFIHSNLGNGKSVLIDILKQQLFNKNITTYQYVKDNNYKEVSEVEKIMKNMEKQVVIIENYFNHLNILKDFSMYDCSNVTFVLTARTMIYDTKLVDVCDYLKIQEGEAVSVDINKLSKAEINNCFEIFEKFEFWGDYTKLSGGKKRKLLMDKDHGNCELQTILLDIIHSSEMKDKLNDIIEKIKKKSGRYYSNIIILLLTKVMSLELDVTDINAIVGVNCLVDPQYLKNEAIRELIVENQDGSLSYKIKSSVIARELLDRVDNDKEIIDSLIRIANYANKYSEIVKYDGVLQTIVSFSHVNNFLKNKRDSLDFIIDYYDALSGIEYYKNNSFFWLQYSIACLRYKNYDLAQNYVEVAYAKFRENDANIPFQCDNQQARIYLELIKSGRSKDISGDFTKAHEIIMKPKTAIKDREENTVRLLYTYVNRLFKGNIEKEGIIELYQIRCAEAYNKVNSYLQRLRNERDRQRYEHLKDLLLKNSVKK